jgi:NADPH:quinone reductase-like Zn-dependent oxidoreductase
MEIPAEMKALLLKHDGYSVMPSGSELEALEPYVTLDVVPVPVPKPSQLLIKVSLASINPSDVMFLKGMYGQPRQKGHPAGFEGIGIVVAAGDELLAKSFVGKRVAFAAGLTGWGSWAEYAVAEAGACIPLTETVRDEDGAAMIVNPLTALAMFDIVRQEGEKAFILTAGASQLGKLIISLAWEEGFRPIAIVRRDDQIPLLREIGAAHVLNAEDANYRASLKEILKAEQPRIFLDAVTGPLASGIFHLMPRHSRWIIYGSIPRGRLFRSLDNSSSRQSASKAFGCLNGCANRASAASMRPPRRKSGFRTGAGRRQSRQLLSCRTERASFTESRASTCKCEALRSQPLIRIYRNVRAGG